MDAKQAPNPNGNSEDFSWNAVWQSGAKIHSDGWSFEMFLPYSAIRFGKKKVQDWGLNIVAKDKKRRTIILAIYRSHSQWILTQEGMLMGLTDINPRYGYNFPPIFRYTMTNLLELINIKAA